MFSWIGADGEGAGVDHLAIDGRGNSAVDWTHHTVRGHEGDIVLKMPKSPGHRACCELLERANRLWSVHVHDLFPEVQRRRAEQLLLLGHLLWKGGWGMEPDSHMDVGGGLIDLWLDRIMPLAIGNRGDGI